MPNNAPEEHEHCPYGMPSNMQRLESDIKDANRHLTEEVFKLKQEQQSIRRAVNSNGQRTLNLLETVTSLEKAVYRLTRSVEVMTVAVVFFLLFLCIVLRAMQGVIVDAHLSFLSGLLSVSALITVIIMLIRCMVLHFFHQPKD